MRRYTCKAYGREMSLSAVSKEEAVKKFLQSVHAGKGKKAHCVSQQRTDNGTLVYDPESSMSTLLSIDPGLRKTGWAVWQDSQLILCGLSEVPKSRPFSSLPDKHQHQICVGSGYWAARPIRRAVCERMETRYGNAKGDVQDLIDLNLLAGALGTEWITAREWKGSRPRAIEQARTRKTLRPEELELLPVLKTPNSAGHDVWSAVGIGLYVLGRYTSGQR